MPVITQSVACPVRDSFRVQQVASLFDVSPAPRSESTFAVEVPSLEEEWSIGAIVGPSASGKSTIAAAAFGAALRTTEAWPADMAVVDAFGDLPIRTITRTLAAVGFNSPPAWLRPYHALSQGERFRCDLARSLLSPGPLAVCDEFTSVVDRTVAKVASAAVAKAIRSQRLAKRFVAVTCHYDVLEWLEADWVLDMATGALGRGRLRRPKIELRVVRCPQALWHVFARHHYLTGSLARGAACYVAIWNDEPVAFCAVVRALGHAGQKRITRLVTLPDYQGLGIGTRLLEHVAASVMSSGERVSITTGHPAMCDYLRASPRWLCKRVRRSYKPSRQVFRNAAVRDSGGRAVVSFEFLG